MIPHKLLNHVKKYSTIGGIFKLIANIMLVQEPMSRSMQLHYISVTAFL